MHFRKKIQNVENELKWFLLSSEEMGRREIQMRENKNLKEIVISFWNLGFVPFGCGY